MYGRHSGHPFEGWGGVLGGPRFQPHRQLVAERRSGAGVQGWVSRDGLRPLYICCPKGLPHLSQVVLRSSRNLRKLAIWPVNMVCVRSWISVYTPIYKPIGTSGRASAVVPVRGRRLRESSAAKPWATLNPVRTHHLRRPKPHRARDAHGPWQEASSSCASHKGRIHC